MTREFNSLEEIKKYYDKNTNAFVFKENGKLIDLVVFNFDLDVSADIFARDIKAMNIKVLDIKAANIKALDIRTNNITAWNIKALDISANNINAEDINAGNIWAWNMTVNNITALHIRAWDISSLDISSQDIEANNILYYAVCYAYNNIKCNSIKGVKDNAKHFVLDGKIEIKNA